MMEEPMTTSTACDQEYGPGTPPLASFMGPRRASLARDGGATTRPPPRLPQALSQVSRLVERGPSIIFLALDEGDQEVVGEVLVLLARAAGRAGFHRELRLHGRYVRDQL